MICLFAIHLTGFNQAQAQNSEDLEQYQEQVLAASHIVLCYGKPNCDDDFLGRMAAYQCDHLPGAKSFRDPIANNACTNF